LGGHDNVQHLAHFKITFDLDRDYLKNRSIYQKRETNFIESSPCCVEQKIGELWSTNKKVIDADVDPPKIDSAHDFKQL